MSRIAISLMMLAAGLIFSGVATAGAPSPQNWTVPPIIPVVGFDANGVADPVGDVTIVARDLANNPMVGAHVTLEFAACSDVILCADPHDPDAVVDCGARTISKITGAGGIVHFRVVGGSIGTPGGPGDLPNGCLRVYGDGVLVASPLAPTFDLVGVDGLTPSDLSAWLMDFFSADYHQRSDLDGNGLQGASDLSRWMMVYFANASIQNCAGAAHCPRVL